MLRIPEICGDEYEPELLLKPHGLSTIQESRSESRKHWHRWGQPHSITIDDNYQHYGHRGYCGAIYSYD